MTSPREAAFLSLCSCEEKQKYANLELDATIRRYGFTGADRALYTALLYGVIEKRLTLDYYLSRVATTPPEKMESRVRNILRLGLYQILFMDAIPDRAAVNESVELSKLHSHKGADKFVNAVLRGAIRKKEELVPPSEEKEGAARCLSIRFSLPEWLCESWISMYGRECAGKLAEASCRHPMLTLRVNTLKTDRESVLSLLRRDGIECEPSPIAPYGIRLTSYAAVSDLGVLRDGLCFVQDEASQLCTEAVMAQPGETVVDTCCCPGGKSFGIALSMQNQGFLLSLDLHASKLSLVEEGANRLGIMNLKTRVHNGSHPLAEMLGKADRVLCDVPCSGLGVIAKKPDLREKDPESLAKLPSVQYEILKAGAAYLKPGGRLIYSTCTVNVKENEEVAKRFLSENTSDFEEAPLSVFPDEKEVCMKTLFPFEHDTDGFFLAAFRRK